MTKFGFLSFGHYADVPGSRVRTAGEMLRQSIELAVAAEEVGLDGAFFRVHHFARQAASPMPLLSAIGARTSRIDMGTGVIDLRYEIPAHLAEEASAVDLIAGGERLQLGVSRGSPEPALEGYRHFGGMPDAGQSPADMARERGLELLRLLDGGGLAQPDANESFDRAALVDGLLPVEPRSSSLRQRIWWGAGTRATGLWAAQHGFNLQSSTLLLESDGRSLGEIQAEQIAQYREAFAAAGWGWSPQVSVSRSIVPIVDDETYRYFGVRAHMESQDQYGYLDGAFGVFGRSYIGAPDRIVAELRDDPAVMAADYVLVTVPNLLGVDLNATIFESLARDIRPGIDA